MALPSPGSFPGRTIEVTIVDAGVIAGLSHDSFKRKFASMTGTPLSEIKGVFNYDEVRQWYVTSMSNQKYEALNMKEFVVRRARVEPGERFRLFMITTMCPHFGWNRDKWSGLKGGKRVDGRAKRRQEGDHPRPWDEILSCLGLGTFTRDS